MLIPAEVLSLSQVEQGDVVLIRPKGHNIAVPILIGSPEADSILLGIKKVPIPRPLTHDLLISVLEALNVPIKRVEITELNGSTFYARLVVLQNEEEIYIDSRPSDCIAIVVRTQCELFIDEMVVDEAGVPINFIDKYNNEETKVADDVMIVALKDKLEEAVQDENYEEAAVIRDKIKELEQKV